MGVTVEQVWQALATVNDPEYPLSIVDLGMVYAVEVAGDAVTVNLTFTAMGCPAIDMIVADAKEAVGALAGVRKLNVEIVWNPPWTKDKITRKGREILQYYGVGV